MQNFAFTLIQIMLGVSVLILILLLLRPFLLKHYKAVWRRAVWLILALRLVIPYNFALPPNISSPITVPVYNVNIKTPEFIAKSNVPNQISNIANSIIINDNTNSNVNISPVPPSLTITQILCAAWVSVFALLFLVRIFLYFVAKHKLLKHHRQNLTAQLLLRETCTSLNINRKIQLKICPSAGTPMLIGLICPKIILPNAQYSDAELSIIYQHELMHYKNGDIIYKMLLNFVCCIYWFNPLIWAMSSIAGRDIELACDEKLLRNKAEDFKSQYSNTIMLVLRQNTQKPLLCATYFGGAKRDIKLRFSQIFDTKVKKHGIIALCSILLLATMLSTFVACKEEGVPSSSQSSPAISADNSYVEAPTEAIALALGYIKYVDLPYPQTDINGVKYDYSYLGYGYLAEKQISEGVTFLPPQALEGVLSIEDSFNISSAFLDNIVLNENYKTLPVTTFTRGKDIFATLKSFSTGANGELSLVFTRHSSWGNLSDVTFTMSKTPSPVLMQGDVNIFENAQNIYKITSVTYDDEVWPILQEESKTVILRTYDDLISAAKDEAINGFARTSITYELGGNIDCNGKELVPIGYRIPRNNEYEDFFDAKAIYQGFCGIFDGKGYTISNFKISTSYKKSLQDTSFVNAALFGTINTYGEVKNLNILDAKITVDTKNSFSVATGILAGECYGKITNCNVSGSIDGGILIGGLVGSVTGPPTTLALGSTPALITNCTVQADIKGVSSCGLLAGNVNGATISNCSVSGTITAYRNPKMGLSGGTPSNIGGFAGDTYGARITSCSSDARIYTLNSGSAIGAFAGNMRNSICKDCTYNKQNAVNWDAIDWIDEKNATEQEMLRYGVSPV